MPLHTGPRRPSKTNTSSNANEIKTLEVLYRQHILTLRELFPGWSREDLVAAMNEANGDLELTIGRIMEGHANQWGQVKSKKPKPSAPSTGSNQITNTRKLDEHTRTRGVSHSGKSRHGKSRGKSGDKVQRKKKDSEGPPQQLEHEKEKKPSWASILKGPTKTETPPSDHTTASKQNNIIEKTIDWDSNNKNSDHGTTEDSISTNQQIAKGSESADDIVEQPNNPGNKEDLPNGANDTNGMNNTNEYEFSAQTAPDPLDTTTEATTTSATAITTASTIANLPAAEQVEAQDLQQLPGFRKVPVRRLKQEEPVILPGGSYGLENVSLQFGSLNLAKGDEHSEQQEQQHQKEEVSTITTPTSMLINPMPSDTISVTTTTAITTHSQSIGLTSVSLNGNMQGPSSLEHSATPLKITTDHQAHAYQAQSQFNQDFKTQPTPQSQQPQIQQHQQTIQQQKLHSTAPAIDSHVYSYTYTPSALPLNGHLQNFSNPMVGTLPEQYNKEGQTTVNYVNSNVYNQSPSTNNTQLYSRGKYSNLQEEIPPPSTTHGMMGNSISTSTAQISQIPQAGMYDGTATGYDTYYYMPNQYQSYQYIGFQQQQQQQQLPLQPQQQQRHQQQQQQLKQSQSSYVNPSIYPMYGKQNHSVYQNYSTQQPYDTRMLRTDRTQGPMSDKQQYQPSSNLSQMQQYFDTNGLQVQQQIQHHAEIDHGVGQPNAAMTVDFEKQQGLSMPQPMVAHESYQPHYQQYHHQQQPHHQQHQQSFHQHQSYNSVTPNNTINAYSTWQNQPQQHLFWQQA